MQLVAPLLLALLATPAAGVFLRQAERESQVADPPAKPAEIKEKWSKMDEFLNVMFTMACKWKNGKDVDGLAAEKLKDGEVEGADGYAAYKTELQAKNVDGLKRACGYIIADSKKKCRDGCAARWNQMATKRNDCDEKCVALYANFEKSCDAKAENLVEVYKQKSSKAAGQKQCYEGHCKEFPQVWMKEDEAKMTTEVGDQCKKRCTDDNVKAGCQRKWALEVDFITAEVASKCAEASGVKKCFDDKKTKTSADYDKCKTDTKKSCDDAFTDCKTKGNTDNTFKDAEAFCTDRKKMCQGQADKKCLKENNAGLDKAEKECKSEASEELTKCQDDKLETAEKDAEEKCIAKRGPTCKKDCEGSCQVTKMNECLLTLSGGPDPGKMFCQDFWHMLHESAEVDPVTGDPMPLF